MQSFSVSQFIEFLNAALTAAVFPEGAVVEGEVTGYRVSQGKWIWFDLKDEQSLISCFATTWQLRQPLEDGLTVRVFGQPRVHAKSGRFSLNVERLELVGEGALRRAFELLKRKLAAEGIFAPERKRPLPRFPRRIGLIASGGSAAYGDFLKILGNRWGGLTINHADVQVQGRDAVPQIVAAFKHFNAHPELAEVVVLTRGGGSLEDLQAFNSEEVARAVFGSSRPVLVGVGHERDETLADYSADVRASTPSNAAELLVPDRRDVATALGARQRDLFVAIGAATASRSSALRAAAVGLDRGVRRYLRAFALLLATFRSRLTAVDDETRQAAAFVGPAADRLATAARRLIEARRQAIMSRERLLRGLDPRRLLERGYAVARVNGRIARDAARVPVGAELTVQLARGSLLTEVKKQLTKELGTRN